MTSMDIDFKEPYTINTINGLQEVVYSNDEQAPPPQGVGTDILESQDPHHQVEPYVENLGSGYVHDVRMMSHTPLHDHPELPGRISRIFDVLAQNHVIQHMTKLALRLVEREEVLLVHSEDHWEKVEAIQFMTHDQIIDSESYYEQLSLYVHPDTTLAARLSCGGVIECALAVARGQVQNSFAIVRPPGHHAEPDEHMGFCFFNNVAIAARVVQQETHIKRILILDWDVHHGNGTQRAFYDDPTVLYISLHRFDNGRFYPCGPFGGMSQCGEGEGMGSSVNIPWPERGMGDADYLYAFQKLIMPIAYEFAPELVIISAGFDAADGDDLGECHVTPAGYAHMTHMLSSLAGGKVVVALEGGYNLESISVSALAVAKTLLGSPPPEMGPLLASDVATETVYQCSYVQSRYWSSIDPKSCEPEEEVGSAAVSVPEYRFTQGVSSLLSVERVEYAVDSDSGSQIRGSLRFADILLVEYPVASGGKQKLRPALDSEDIYDNEVIVLFAHDFGSLRAELHGRLECDVRLENSYLIDASRVVVEWCREGRLALIDANIYMKPRLSLGITVEEDASEASRRMVLYLWDNYIELSNAKTVIFIAFGAACQAMMSLVQERAVRSKVKAVVQIVGYDRIPLVPKDNPDFLKSWYRKVSLVLLPDLHPTVQDGDLLKRHGHVESSAEVKPIRVFTDCFKRMQEFIQEKTTARSTDSDALDSLS